MYREAHYNRGKIAYMLDEEYKAFEKVATDLGLGGGFAGYSGSLQYLQQASQVFSYVLQKKVTMIVKLKFKVHKNYTN